MITDDRVKLFCVAAQVLDVNKKIDSAITECMRLGKHAIRTAMVPIPLSGMIGTPTVSRIICEHVLQCFGFPKALPDEVEEIMSRIVLGNLKQFMTVSLTQFLLISSVSVGVAVATMGIGVILGAGSCALAAPPTARMLLKVSCDMILILERSFRYNGKYVSVRQIEDAAKQYTTIKITTFGGKQKLLQSHIHDEVDRLIPLAKVKIGFRFSQLRTDFERLVYTNRFDLPPDYEENDPLSDRLAELEASLSGPAELATEGNQIAELQGTTRVSELENTQSSPPPNIAELPGETIMNSNLAHRTTNQQRPSEMSSTSTRTTTDRTNSSTMTNIMSSPTSMSGTPDTPVSELSASPSVQGRKSEKSKSERPGFLSRMSRSMKSKK